MVAPSTHPSWPALPPQPLVTIVTPSFNQGRFIEATIRSVLEQDYPAIEYIVMDGGSTDGTLEVLRRYGDRVSWLSAPDNGQADAINRGWKRGHGAILAWLNADDTYLPGAVRAAVEYLQQHPAATLVYGDCDYVDQDGAVVGRYPTRSFDYIRAVCGVAASIPQPATFLRRPAVEAVGYLDERLHMSMDLDLWLRLGLRYELCYMPRRLATFRIHPTSKSVAQQVRFAPELLAIYQRLFAQPDLPATLRTHQLEAMSNVMLIAANYFYMAGLLRPARRYALASWRRAPGLQRRTMLKLMVLGPLGRPGWWVFTRGRQQLTAALTLLRSRMHTIALV